MIFASVGSIMPFDRLVRAVDDWAAAHPAQDVFLQIGNTPYEPRHAPFGRIIPIDDYRARLRACDLFVAHVGMGSILQALEERKQMLMLPRICELGEHTTDHQMHSAARFGHLPGLRIARSVAHLQQEMTALLARPLAPGDALASIAPPELLGNVRGFLDGVAARRRPR